MFVRTVALLGSIDALMVAGVFAAFAIGLTSSIIGGVAIIVAVFAARVAFRRQHDMAMRQHPSSRVMT